VKTLVRELAKRGNITESALVKQLLEVVLRTSAMAGFPKTEELDRPNRDARLYVRLDLEDRLLLTSRAAERGIGSATYVALLVRSHLRGVAPVPTKELLALKRAVAELSAIGRNSWSVLHDRRPDLLVRPVQ
jgi:hypothetical protein